MNRALALVSWFIVGCVGTSALVPDIGFHTPIGSDDILPVVATVLGGAYFLFKPMPNMGPVVLLLLALLALGILSNIFVPEHLLVRALVRGPVRVAFYLIFVLGFISVIEELNGQKVLAFCAFCALIEALFGLSAFFLDYIGPWNVGVYFTEEPSQSLAGTGWGRIVGTFNTWNGQGMNFVSGYLMIFVPVLLALGFSQQGLKRVAWLGAGLLVATAMLLTYTRMSLVAGVLGAVAAFMVMGKPKVVVSVVISGLLGIFLTPGLAQRFLDKNDRIKLYAASIDAALQSPWLGHGDIAYLEYIFATSNRYHTMFGIAGSTPHNSILYAFFRYGIGGAILTGLLLLAPILYFAYQARTTHGTARIFSLSGVAAFVSFALQSQTNNLLDVPKVAFYFFVLWVVLRKVIDEASTLGAEKTSSR